MRCDPNFSEGRDFHMLQKDPMWRDEIQNFCFPRLHMRPKNIALTRLARQGCSKQSVILTALMSLSSASSVRPQFSRFPVLFDRDHPVVFSDCNKTCSREPFVICMLCTNHNTNKKRIEKNKKDNPKRTTRRNHPTMTAGCCRRRRRRRRIVWRCNSFAS